ncbi:fibronectin type III and SPRY domain-containing protein 2 isoform X1 [Colossoma macropomum]|uniref:fibronectin type III and SPRY domain-containing protein 2 isoform X1 n=1 Tax=Colossoma macropomum TaxID=42526 RepID=UPI001864B106|nr:fibronectin type III and SPRY domain-containing protein 2 isoform X1 [Colossoma macropomum]XP_036420422.1 fibronectin type III and SPRY domain-containing protein 2 isoform X1 [Colossoma macropomum]
MDMYEMRGRLQVIAEEMAVSEDEEGEGDEESFVMVSKRQATSDSSGPAAPFCRDCITPAQSGHPPNHRVLSLQEAAQDMKTELSQSCSRLTEKISQMENFASNLEEIFITVEENFGRQEQNLEQHYSDVLQTLSQRNSENSTTLQDQKKQKLEALYGQLLACGHLLDTSKELIESAQELHRCQNKRAFLQAVMPVIKRIEDFAKEEVELKVGVSMDFTTPTADLSAVKQMMESINVVPAPSAPVMNPQVVNSATTTSLRVCWSLFSDDTVDFYQLYCRQISEDITTETEQDVSVRRVKETHCVVTDLLPNAQYEFWVTATNTTGISPASERAVYMTVPSPPVIKLQECVSCLEAALIRWDSGNTNPVESYTLELSKADNHSSVTESIVAIPTCECLVQLQPWKRYIINIRAVNIGGASERSQPITISTTGTFFHLLKETAHPSLSVSPDGFTMFYLDEDLLISEMVFSDTAFSSCVAVLGDLIPVRGQHYWEVEVDEWAEYRVGVAYEDTQRTSYLGANATSWCMRHVLTPSRHKYEFLHNGWSADVRITVQPFRIGVFLDYERGTLSFYNALLRQHLHTFSCCFHHYVLPCFALDKPGALTLHTGLTAPKYITHT